MVLDEKIEAFPNFVELDKVILKIPQGSKLHLLQSQKLEENNFWYQIEVSGKQKKANLVVLLAGPQLSTIFGLNLLK